MNDYSLYKHAQQHVRDARKWADNERLARQALQGREQRISLAIRVALWIGKELIAAGTILKTRAEQYAGIFTIMMILFMPTAGITRPYAQASTGCDPSLVDTSWIAQLPANEQFNISRLARMELRMDLMNGESCSTNLVEIAMTGAAPAVDPLPPECATQDNPASVAWIASQKGLERVFIQNQLKLECSDPARVR